MNEATRVLVLIGASTGGVDALTTVLERFPKACPPTMIVQHTGEGYGKSLVQLLDQRCRADVVPARHGLRLREGLVCLAAGNKRHLKLSPQTPCVARLDAGPPMSGHIPSVNVLFKSAVPIADRVVACLLTGMGSDGA